MKKNWQAIIIIFILLIILAVFYYFFTNQTIAPVNDVSVLESVNEKLAEISVKRVDFLKINKDFLFSAEIPEYFDVEYIPNLRAINIYDKNLLEEKNIEKSKIFITFFRANEFLTLKTVKITQNEPTNLKGREAILYEITKKEEVPNFLGQPSWRNLKHKALDVKYSDNNPTYFYSFAYDPNLSEEIFNNFLNSIDFYNLEIISL